MTRIEVTAEDIARGQRGRYNACPHARAIKRVLRRGRFGGLDGVYLDFRDSFDLPSVKLPQTASRWIWDFDRGLPLEPITYDLDLQPGVARA
jgi:hypothetical protein